MNIRILLFYWIMSSLLITVSSCGNNPKPEEKRETVKLDDTLTIPDPSQDSHGTPMTEDTASIQELQDKEKTPDEEPPNYSSLPGPVGFVNEDNLVLREKPSAKSNKIATLKIKETIYILETSMLGVGGEHTQYPTWYRIERKSKERGWVKASAISTGH